MSTSLPSSEQPVSFRHLPAYRVLLCVACGYCVLFQALETHLKCIHRVPIARRRKYIKHARTLRLAEIQDVIYPGPQERAIPGSPGLEGLVCEAPACSYICATSKRMHAHWTTDHYALRQQQDIERYQCRPALVQTFFRGRNLRYFVVSTSMRDGLISKEIVPKARTQGVPAQDFVEKILLKHFFESTIHSVRPVQGTSPQWNTLIMQQCHTYDFLRYAVLSITACHIAHEHTAQRQLYSCVADRYRYLAIKTMPRWSEEEQLNQFFTQFNFIRMMDLSYLANENLRLFQTPTGECIGPRDSILSDWVSVTRSGREIWFRQRGEGRERAAMCARVMRFEEISNMQEADLHANPYDRRLTILWNRLLCSPFSDANSACLKALALLRRAWAVPYHDGSLGFRDVALLWLASVPEDFLQCVRKHYPDALLVLAFYCELWANVEEEYWYMKHRAQSTVLTIKQFYKECKRA